jgi:hypothetical protein
MWRQDSAAKPGVKTAARALKQMTNDDAVQNRYIAV